MFLIKLLATVMLATAAFTPARAESPSVEATSAPDSSDIDASLSAYDRALFQKRYGDALTIADKLPPLPENKEWTAIIAAMRASAMVGLGRTDDARRLIEQADQLAPQSPEPSRIVFLGGLIAKNFEVAADALDRMIDRFPDVMRELEWDDVTYLLRNESKGAAQRNEDRRIALARLGYGGDAERGDWLAAGAITLLMKRGDAASARIILRYVDEPRAIENMLILRRFEPLWPELEAMAGKHLAKVRASSVAGAERAFAERPDDHEALNTYANALRHAGQYKEAIALRSKLPSTSAEMAKADEQLGWAVNNVALALHEAGRADEADRLFAMLNDAPMPPEGWRISMKINRLNLLVTDGKFDRALPLIEPTAKVDGTPFAKQLVRRMRYCTLSKLGRKEEASKLVPNLLKHAEDAYVPTIEGLVCAGQLDHAEQVALQALKSDKEDSFAEDMVRALQPNLLTSDEPSVWQGLWTELRLRPAIAQSYHALGRDMPVHLLPPPLNDPAAK